MPNIKECLQILKSTPCNQSVLFRGVHGCGKSQIVSNFYISKGYRVQTLFVGQASDAGDLIGLPDREKNESTGYIHTVFRPPFWWPKKEGEKFVLILDEFNRGKDEVMQCVMDMVLNRKLMGKDLPEECIVIALENPLMDDGYYLVNEKDPALIDRFNVYDFKPTNEEWLHWAMTNKLHKHVIGFIGKNNDLLDPNTKLSSGVKVNDIQQSRRSWHKVSDILLHDEDVEYNLDSLRVILEGIVGSKCTSRFSMYLKEKRNALSADRVIMHWDNDIKSALKKYDKQDIIHMNRQVVFWFKEYIDVLIVNDKMQVTAMKGLAKYLATIGTELESQLFNIIATDNSNKETYAKKLFKINPDVAENYFRILNEQEKEREEELERNLKGE